MSNNLDRPAVVTAAAASGTAAVLMFSLLPIVNGALADRYQLSDAELGLTSLAYFTVYSSVALLATAWIRRWSWRQASVVGFGLLAAGVATLWAAELFWIALLGLCVFATGAGILFPVSLTLVSDMANPDRGYGFKGAAEGIVPGALLFLLASSLFANTGFGALMVALFVLVLVCGIACYAMPRGGGDGTTTAGHGGSALLGYGSLLALVIAFVGYAGLWAFFERIGVEQGFEASFINFWLGVSLVMSGVGPLLAAIAQAWMSRTSALVLGMGIAVAVMAMFSGDVSARQYAFALALQPLSYYFGFTFLLALVADADHNGRVSALMGFVLGIGAGLGPAIVGWLRTVDAPVLPMVGGLVVAGVALAIWIQRSLEQSPAVETT